MFTVSLKGLPELHAKLAHLNEEMGRALEIKLQVISDALAQKERSLKNALITETDNEIARDGSSIHARLLLENDAVAAGDVKNLLHTAGSKFSAFGFQGKKTFIHHVRQSAEPADWKNLFEDTRSDVVSEFSNAVNETAANKS